MNWKKWLSLAGGAIIVLIFLAYLIFTSSFFLKRVALPIAGNFLKMEIKADSIDLDGLSKISIQNLKLTPNNEETILEAAEIQISLSSFSSPISIEEVFLDKASINIVQTPDGGNLTLNMSNTRTTNVFYLVDGGAGSAPIMDKGYIGYNYLFELGNTNVSVEEVSYVRNNRYLNTESVTYEYGTDFIETYPENIANFMTTHEFEDGAYEIPIWWSESCNTVYDTSHDLSEDLYYNVYRFDYNNKEIINKQILIKEIGKLCSSTVTVNLRMMDMQLWLIKKVS